MPAPYDVLAAGYDAVMAHVDYKRWARYVHALLQHHGTDVRRVLELGGGTGTLAVHLQPLGDYDYLLTDGSAAMLRQARAKMETEGRPIRCEKADFTTFTLDALNADPFDAVVLVYDGMNYLTEPDDVATLFRRVHAALAPGGLFVMDQSTPANAEDNANGFMDEGTTDAFSYVRTCIHEPERNRQITEFELTIGDRTLHERHEQRPYTPEQVRDLLAASPLQIEAAYDGRTLDAARTRSYRVHWVARRAPR